jgi:spermidine synthase
LFLSGTATLTIEVVWSRVLHRVLGSGTLSAAIVLGSFLAGMGLGAFISERFARRVKRPLRVFAVLELAAAVLAFCVSGALFIAPDIFRATGGEIFAMLLLVVATVPAGAGFPILLRALPDDEHRSGRVRRLYGLNALGAGVGALLAGLVLVPVVGEVVAVCAGAALQLVVALGVAFLGREATSAIDPDASPSPGVVRAGASFVFLSGFVVFFWEVLWMRLLVLTVGASVYAFATVTASVVLGIGVGSLVFGGRVLSRRGAWVLPLTALALSMLAYLAVPELPRAYLFGVRTFGLDPLACGAIGASLIAFAPNFLLGCLFPWFIAKRVEVAGSLYGINSLGAILGVIAAGPLTAGVVQLEATFRLGLAAIAMLLISGVMLDRASGEGRDDAAKRRMATVFASLVLLAALVDCGFAAAGRGFRSWPYERLLSGVYQWELVRLQDEAALDESYAGREIVAVIEGREVIVSAEIDTEAGANVLYIKGNGKVEGSVPIDPSKPSRRAVMPTQMLLGAAGAAFGRAHSESPCLLIGLGSGVTLGALFEMRKEFDLVAPIDVVEIEPAFLEILEHEDVAPSVRPWFDPSRVQSSVRWHFGDARRVIARDLSNETYGVIVSQPSEPWIVGAAPLFTVEFFREAGERLRPGGVFVQWVQLYRLDTESLQLLLRTFQAVFPNVEVLRPPGAGELILIGSSEPIDLQLLWSAPGRLSSQAALRCQRASGVTSGVGWLALHLVGSRGVRRFAGEGYDFVNTDRTGELEFRAPRALDLGLEQARRHLDALREVGGGDPVTDYLPESVRVPKTLRLIARANIVVGDLDEARAVLDEDDSSEADTIRRRIADAEQKMRKTRGSR